MKQTKTRPSKIPMLLSLFTLLCSLWAQAQVDPSIHWKVMKLPHFDLMFDAKHQELADLYADRLEDNLQFLSQYFEIFPARTVVVIDDRTDLTNGYATPLPYGTIVLYPVLPGPQETISDYGDWARELVMHEYTHILSFQPRRGLVKGLYYTFGNIITPNILLPRWWLEGIAVDMETRNSDRGRLRSPYQDAAVRAYASEHQLENVQMAEINEVGIHTWPQGARPYLFGSLLWSDLIAKYGKEKIKELHWAYGGRMPYFIEGPVEDFMGTDYIGIFANTKKDLSDRVNDQMKTLKTVPFTEGTTLTVKNGIENFFPVISPDGKKMIFLSKGDSNKRSVRILARPSLTVAFDGSQEMAEINQRFGESSQDRLPTPKGGIDESEGSDSPPGGTIQRLSWFPDSTRFIFDKIDNLNRYHEVSDLYVFDLGKMKVEQITHGERAREASISPDSQMAAFVKLDAGKTYLAILDLNEKKSKVIYSPALQSRISYPSFVSNGEVIFSERDSKGREVLKKISIASGQIQEVLPNYPDARFPQMTLKGLIFTSNKNGTGNLYVASSDLKSARPLTHTSTFVSSSAWDDQRQEVYETELTTKGFQIRQTSAAASLPHELPKIQPLLADRYPAAPREVPVIAKPEAEEYNPWPYLLPTYWLPNLYFYDGGALIGASTSVADPLNKHAYSIAAAYDTEPKETSLSLLYANNTTPATILVKGLDLSTRVSNTSIKFRQQNYEIDSLWEIPAISTDLKAGVGVQWLGRNYTFADAHTEAYGPSLLASYNDINMSGAQISPESGQTADFSVTGFFKGQKEDQEDFRLYQLSIQKYFSKWLPRHNAILIRAQGQFIDKAPTSNPDPRINTAVAYDAFSLAYNPFANGPTPFYIMRGYMNGQFLGRSLANYTFEYRFPIAYPYSGSGTTPLFLRRIHAALIADGISVDGYSYNKSIEHYERVNSWRSFWSAGAELKFDVTLGYHIPATFYLGLYEPLDSKYRDGQNFGIGIQL
jgi:hypothetical protein